MKIQKSKQKLKKKPKHLNQKNVIEEFFGKALTELIKNNTINLKTIMGCIHHDDLCTNISFEKGHPPQAFVDSWLYNRNTLGWDEVEILTKTLMKITTKEFGGICSNTTELQIVSEILARGYIMGVYAGLLSLAKANQELAKKRITNIIEPLMPKFKKSKKEI